ncbi:TonB-dependent receptor [Thiohalorhabdus sp. Cl-TMA]|uniref:TonB-dependent receptor n=1 Tax=Thiohalorhabdus methylotrophus TaxID=3242694 RepID=A0ABV4U0U3_9GAMM
MPDKSTPLGRKVCTPTRPIQGPAKLALGSALAALAVPGVVHAQSGMDGEELEPITVSTTRTSQGRPLSAIPGSVTVIGEEQIEEQTRFTQDMGEILSNLVPGLGQSSENLTNLSQHVRGRDFLVMIDGVPQNATLRPTSKFLRSIAPEAVAKVEVIRGAVATYGFGATGGIINFITKSGEGVEGTAFQSTVGVTGQTDDSDSLGSRVYQGVRGGSGAFDYSVNLSAKETGTWYDGEGDVVPPDGFSQGGGLSDSVEYNAQTKLGYQIGPDQRIRFTANYYERTQDADHTADRSTGDTQTDTKTVAVKGDPEGKDPGTENLNVSLDYTHADFLGGTLSSQLYYQDYETFFSYFSGYDTGGGQSKLLTEHTGFRLAHDRPIGFLNAVYGIDLGQEKTSQPLIDGRTNVPEMEQVSYSPFLQLEAPLGRDWLVRGGVRYENFQVDVPTFQRETVNNPGTIEGGTLDYSETVFNLGAVHYLTRSQELFASFSQGYSVADIGRVLRTKSADGEDTSAEALDPEAQIVNNYELGWRGRFDHWRATATAFVSTSDLGTTFEGADLELERKKERIYGVELTGDVQATRALRLGGTATWQEGRTEDGSSNDSDLDAYLSGIRISPPELTAYAEYAPSERWSARLQAKHLFDRDRFDGSEWAYGEGEFNGFTLLHASGQAQVGPGRLSLGIRNLLDKQYITPLGQVYNLDMPGRTAVIAGRGRSYSLEYTMTY